MKYTMIIFFSLLLCTTQHGIAFSKTDITDIFQDQNFHTPTLWISGSNGTTVSSSENNEAIKGNPHWLYALDQFQLGMTIIGFFANTVTAITLVKNGRAFTPATLMLLVHQSCVDSITCGMASLLLVTPYYWVSGYYVIDILLCHAWHGQAVYWGMVFVSIWNLVCLAFERYLAVVRPFYHANFTPEKLRFFFVALYIGCIIAPCGAYIHTRLENGKCLPKYFMDGPAVEMFFKFFSVGTFVYYYCIPCTFFCFFYGSVLVTFQKRKKTSELGSSRIIDKASSDLTKTAITVTTIFIFAIGYDMIYYMLGFNNVVEYINGSVLQKIGVLLASFNSVANPFVYGILMPSYRHSIKMTFCQHCVKNKQ